MLEKHKNDFRIILLSLVFVMCTACKNSGVNTEAPIPPAVGTSTRSAKIEITTIYKTPTPVGTCSGKIIFSKIQGGNHEIFSTNMGTFSPVNLTQNPANDSDPYCSPDGKLIAFWSDRDSDNYPIDIFSMNLDGSNVVNITNQSVKLKGGVIYWSWDNQKTAALHTLYEYAIITLYPYSVEIIPVEEFHSSDWYFPNL